MSNHPKRITIFCGHYGSGKTNIAVNFALHLRQTHQKVAILDLDIVNPYFRTKDSQTELDAAGVELICSDYAGSNLDIPALPAAMQRPIADHDTFCVLDIGGDDQGAVALGRFADQIKAEGNYDMLFVSNFFRPLTKTAQEALEVLRDIETACHLPFTGIVNNSNIGDATAVDDILLGAQKAKELSALSGLPLVMTSVREDFADAQALANENVFPLHLQEKLI
ncbi:MAG: hypothetical protein IJU56_04240 [Clostridia bacterium]|nr:hypothetical protein [Clostridia bacterium]